MDRQYIEDEQIIERYLSGDLTVREAREFQRICRAHPELLDEWQIPPGLKMQLAQSNTEQGWQDGEGSPDMQAIYADPESSTPPRSRKLSERRHRVGRLAPALGVALLASAAGLIGLTLRARHLDAQLREVKHQMQIRGLQAHSSVHTYRTKLVRGRPQGPTLSLGWPVPPALLDMYIDVTEGNYDSFQVTIDRLDGSRVLQIKRIARDSNRELRLALNSSAFGPGEYLMKFDGYTWRGQAQELGWIMLGLE